MNPIASTARSILRSSSEAGMCAAPMRTPGRAGLATGEGRNGPGLTATAGTEAGGKASAPIDGARVAELRGAVREGRYAISPQRIAEAMIAAPGLCKGGAL